MEDLWRRGWREGLTGRGDDILSDPQAKINEQSSLKTYQSDTPLTSPHLFPCACACVCIPSLSSFFYFLYLCFYPIIFFFPDNFIWFTNVIDSLWFVIRSPPYSNVYVYLSLFWFIHFPRTHYLIPKTICVRVCACVRCFISAFFMIPDSLVLLWLHILSFVSVWF